MDSIILKTFVYAYFLFEQWIPAIYKVSLQYLAIEIEILLGSNLSYKLGVYLSFCELNYYFFFNFIFLMLIKADVYLCIRNGEFKQQIWALFNAIGHSWCMENIMRLFKPIPNSPKNPQKT